MRSVVSFGMNANGSSFVLRLSPGDLRVGDRAPEKVLGIGLSGTGAFDVDFGFFVVFSPVGESSDCILLLLFSLSVLSLSSEESELPRMLLLLDFDDLDEFEDFDERLDFEESELELSSSLSLLFFLTPGLDGCESVFGFSESVSSLGLTRLP